MTREEAIDVIKNESKCVRRQGNTGECCRDEMGCGACDLVMEDTDILEAYEIAIACIHHELDSEREVMEADFGNVEIHIRPSEKEGV